MIGYLLYKLRRLWYYFFMADCVFCKIVKGEIPAKKAYEDDELLAFHDLNPQAPLHLLVIPKKHIPTVMDLTQEDSALMGKLLFKAQQLAAENGCAETGGRFVFNCKSHGGQTVDHIHCHVLGGRFFKWPPG